MRGTLILTLLLIPSEAWLSGSSVVESTSGYFTVSIESARMIFEDSEGEAEWHADWRAQHRPMVERLRKKIEAKLPGEMQKNRYPLIRYKSDYPEVRESSLDEEEYADIVKKPFRCRFEFNKARIHVAFARLPPAAVRASLKRALAEMLR